jgi:poly-gamma-glutamate synthesis protein (capsule biosynthesis protein)
MVIGHGPHLLRGLELYKGKPIFYSLGNFIFEHEYVQRFPADDYETLSVDPGYGPTEVARHISKGDTQSFPADRMYWETVLPLCTFDGHRLADITLYPLTLGFGHPWPGRGIPRLADATLGAEVLDWMTTLSRPFGTRMTVRDGVGTVQV